MSGVEKQSVNLFYETLSLQAFGCRDQIVQCGAETLELDAETHTSRILKLVRIKQQLLRRGWYIHFVRYAYRDQCADWVFYASREVEANAYIQEGLDRWDFHHRARGFYIQCLDDTMFI